MNLTSLTTLSTPHLCAALTISVNCYAALSPLIRAQAQLNEPPSIQARAQVETEHTTGVEKGSCWIDRWIGPMLNLDRLRKYKVTDYKFWRPISNNWEVPLATVRS